jgi:penicillin-binding protein 2
MDTNSNRRYIIIALISGVFIVYIIRLFFLQIVDTRYRLSAQNNSQRFVTQYPARGLIYDRDGKLLVYNQAAYDMMVIPEQLQEFDTLTFCNMLAITKNQLIDGLQAARRFSRFQPSVVVRQLSAESYARMVDDIYRFPGFYVQARTLRKYNKPIAAHILGYVGEVDEALIKRDSYYQMGDYIGISGIEKAYEADLRGQKGRKIFLVDVNGKTKGSFQGGKYDIEAVSGADLTCSINTTIQEYGEKLMKPYRGSIVVIEPATGEILSLITSPAYDPALLVGRVRNVNFRMMSQDTVKPLFNRALMARYPPGSTFKLINALIGLKEGVINESTTYSCAMGTVIAGMIKKCHSHASPLDLIRSIQNSCNTYYFNVFRKILENPDFSNTEDAYGQWRSYVMSFGFGKTLNTDFPNELSGYIPTSGYFDKIYGRSGWRSVTIVSMGIGQGELGITPLQMANMAATIANRGYYYSPHVIKRINTNSNIDPRFEKRNYAAIDSSFFVPVIRGMELAVNDYPGGGTATIASINGITVCGKTGTAQNPHGADHSIFTAFAPKDNPKIAIAVYVENTGFGGSYAAPIASLIIEKYLSDTISRPWIETMIMHPELRKKNEKNN